MMGGEEGAGRKPMVEPKGGCGAIVDFDVPLSVDLCQARKWQAYNTTNVNMLHWVVVIVSSVQCFNR